ncbi:glycoside hydrolase family 5 protein [Streptomyces sp. SAJ15]|uniref:glycoside hydrolase family 5 protein n=1 Tax=Streptomyces sp. SAJ15 TaxID=2011095 RepID=UPI001186B596|nr:cellulase family glycosylhydrolase [Streptomyces sp. SAJ15]TVL88640.1 glycoside hydrolase [Streptomyces sp. SAJ15]
MRRLPTRRALTLAALSALLTGFLPAAPGGVHASATTAATATGTASWAGPLSTRGRYIVDAAGNRFKLKSANWGGAQGSWTGSGDRADAANHHAGENSHQTPLGLDRTPLSTLLADFHRLGLNSVRLPFSNEMIHTTAPVPDSAVAANPRLRGKTPLEVYDAVVAALTGDGFAVILNNHTITARWCCGLDGNERWNTSQTTARWVDDWAFMAARYRDDKRVVAADLYNEVRRDILDDPNWGGGDRHDWFAAAQQAADRILTRANPDLLIVVEGINWTGIPADGLPHDRPTLTPARTLSHTLTRSGKLVYSAHFYGFTGPRHSGATGIGETHDPRYQDLSRAELYQVLREQAFFVTDDGTHHTAPLWVSEFGTGAGETGAKARAWFTHFTDHLAAQDTDFAYWPLVGWSGDGKGDDFALLRYDTTGRRSGILDDGDWRTKDWRKLVDAPARGGPITAGARWNMLTLDHADAVRSLRTLAQGDWDPGARKGVCPDGQRLIGLAHTGGRGLCTDTGTGDLRAAGDTHTVVRDERYVTGGDWATGYTKLECPAGQFLIGYSLRGAAVSAALCVPARERLALTGHTVWFDRGDNRPDGDPGGEFAHGRSKGQCASGEYAAGIAYTRRIGSLASPDALLCRPL